MIVYGKSITTRDAEVVLNWKVQNQKEYLYIQLENLDRFRRLEQKQKMYNP